MWYTKLIYLVLLIIGLFFSVLYEGIFSMLLLGVLILLPLTQLWLVHHVRRRLSVSLSLAQTEMGRGTSQKLYCTLQNKSHFPLNYCHVTLNLQQVATKETEQLELQLPLQGNFAATVSFQFAAMHCGKLRISVKKCRIADYFHLFSCSVRKCTAAEMTIQNCLGFGNFEIRTIRNGFTGNAAAGKKRCSSRNTADRWRNNVPSGSTGHKPKPCKSRGQKWMPRWRQPMPLPVF